MFIFRGWVFRIFFEKLGCVQVGVKKFLRIVTQIMVVVDLLGDLLLKVMIFIQDWKKIILENKFFYCVFLYYFFVVELMLKCY